MVAAWGEKPNVLMIMTDQHRFDRLSCIDDGGPRTPNIDALASEGVTFTNAYTPSPVCAPARAAIKSGMYPPGCGVVGNWVPFDGDIELMTHRLQASGYETALVGKLHFVPSLAKFGFDFRALHDAPYSVYAHDSLYSDYIHWLRQQPGWENRDPVELFDDDENAFKTDDWGRFVMGGAFRSEQEHDVAWVTRESKRYLAERDESKPFFMFTSYFGPHQPFDPPEPWRSMYAPKDVALPAQFGADMRENPVFAARDQGRSEKFRGMFTQQDYQRMIAAYYGQVSMIDHFVGELFDDLKERGLWDNTMVIFLSDHGDHNGAYGLFFKGQMYDSCCKVPLFIKPAIGLAEGNTRDQVVNTLDLYGTILDAADDSDWRCAGIEARTLSQLLEGDDPAWDNETYSIIGVDPNSNLSMLRRGHLKLIRGATGRDSALYELYDMRHEPVEVRDVFEDPSYRPERDDLVRDLDTWWARQAARYPDHVISYVRPDAR